MTDTRRLDPSAQRTIDLADIAWRLAQRAALRELAALFKEAGVRALHLPWLDPGDRAGRPQPEGQPPSIDVLVAPAFANIVAEILERHGWTRTDGWALRALSGKESYAKDAVILGIYRSIVTFDPWPRRLAHLETSLWQGASAGLDGLLAPRPEPVYVFRAMQASTGPRHFWNVSQDAPNAPAARTSLDRDELRRIAERSRLGEVLEEGADARPSARLLPESLRGRIREAFAMRQAGFGFISVPRRGTRVWVEELELVVPPGVFVPRFPITTSLLDVCSSLTEKLTRPLLVEVGTGCGAFALGFARRRPDARVVALDISHRAVSCARRNRDRSGAHSVHIVHSDLLETLPNEARGLVDVVAANVPYVPPATAARTDWGAPVETARGSDADGLGMVLELARQATAFLRPGGNIVLQCIGWQWDPLAAELKGIGYEPREPNRWGDDRAAIGSAIWNHPPTARPDRRSRA